jgi:phosphoribosyl-ATP pyrophosphohydrolase
MSEQSHVLDLLFAAILERRTADPAVSYTAKLLGRGTPKIAQKLGEEAVETAIEAVLGNRKALVGESSDLLYHLLVLWADAGITPADVWEELQRRQGISGIAEKQSRKGS